MHAQSNSLRGLFLVSIKWLACTMFLTMNVVASATRAEEQGNPKPIRPGSILAWFIH
jgi:hypothetical protein